MSVRKIKGFTLLEMMLVLVIASSLLIMALNLTEAKMDQMRRERTAILMQSVLNAAASYYVVYSAWPSNISALQTAGFLPSNTYASSWGESINGSVSGSTFKVSVTFTHGSSTQNNALAQIIAGMLPLGTPSGATVNGYINIPGENLNNAMAVNYGAVYYNGACVPAPQCPTGMTSTLMVVPVAAAGVITPGPSCTSTSDPSTCSTITTNSINSFSAFYRGTSVTNTAPTTSPLDCSLTNVGGPQAVSCDLGANITSDSAVANTKYWRVCLSVTTASGLSYPSRGDTNAYNEGKLIGNILAITRCMPSSGDVPSGSSSLTGVSGNWSVWTPNSNWTP